MEAVVEVRSLSKRYGKIFALENISLDIYKGEILGLLGPNGAGKSTFISILASVSKPSSGDISINSINLFKDPDKIKRNIGYVPQDIALYPVLSGEDNLDFWAGIYGLSGRKKKERILGALKTVRLEDRAGDRVERYSGGMKRRLNIAVALLHDPEILVMDEPMVGVDIQSRKYILEALAQLKQEGRTIIIASHDMDEMEGLCDRIAVLVNGHIKLSGAPEEVRKQFGAGSMRDLMLGLVE